MEEKTPELLPEQATTERRQNLPEITHISATHSGCIDAVLSTMRNCGSIVLTPEQMDMGGDIVRSVSEHGEQNRGLTAYYLIRYGMLLEREPRGNNERTPENEGRSCT